MDYFKFFDSMEPEFMCKLIIDLGVDEDYAHMILDMYRKLQRHIKIGSTYGEPFHPTNGYGQGDAFSILVALMLVSIQFTMI